MNKEFLRKLNGSTRGKFSQFLETMSEEPRIAWYPSAMNDMRPMMYYSKPFMNMVGIDMPEEELPELFIYTDYAPWGEKYLAELFEDRIYPNFEGYTHVRILHYERLNERIEDGLGELAKGCVSFKNRLPHHGEIYYFDLEIESDLLGVIRVPLLYAFVTNESFYFYQLFRHKVQICHLVLVRYGGSLGGASNSGAWVASVAERLNVRWFYIDSTLQGIKNGWYPYNPYMPYPDLRSNQVDFAEANEIFRLRSSMWSNIGVITLLQLATGDGKPVPPAKLPVAPTSNRGEYLRRAVTLLI